MPRPSRSVRMKSLQRQRRLAEEPGSALVLQHQELALDGSDRRPRDIAEGLRRLADRRQRIVIAVGFLPASGMMASSSARKILHVDQGQAVVVGDAKRDVEHALLHVVEIEHPRQQQADPSR